MSEYRRLDPAAWKRYGHFRHFWDNAPCSVTLCDDIDVTALRDACRKTNTSFYIAFLYTVGYVVNSREEFRLTAIDSPEFEYMMPAVWDRVDVCHNVFHEDDETYTGTFTVWERDFGIFYRNCEEDIARAKNLRIVSVPAPDNVFEASCMPWRHFTSVGVVMEPVQLSPMIAWGKFTESDGKVLMPLSIQIHHAAADGFHLTRFLNETEKFSSVLASMLSGGEMI